LKILYPPNVTHKHLITHYPHCTLCQINDINTWPHLLSLCNNKSLKGLRSTKHNAIAYQLLLKSNVYTRYLTLIDAGNQHGNHQNNTIPPRILSCTCNNTRCECLTKLRPGVIYIQGDAYEQNGPVIHALVLTIQIIEFTFTHDRFFDQAIQTKEDKYNPLINAIRAQSWNIRPLIVITTWVRGTIHTRSIKLLENLHILTSLI
jgi:hypothetical protein